MIVRESPEHAKVAQDEHAATLLPLPTRFFGAVISSFGAIATMIGNHEYETNKPRFIVSANRKNYFPLENLRSPSGYNACGQFGRAGTIWATASFRCWTAEEIMEVPNLSWGAGIGGIVSKKLIRSEDRESLSDGNYLPRTRIAIIGGGLAGVTAATAIAARLKSLNSENNRGCADIVIFEEDPKAYESRNQDGFDIQTKEQPKWMAATAKNANSIVPGAAMHIMSQRHTLLEIAQDTFNEWMMLHVENFKRITAPHGIKNIDNFDINPPYFSLHLFHCLGPSASWNERFCFATFLRHFVLTSLLTGENHADDRGKHIVQLAKSSRFAFLRDVRDPRKAASVGGRKSTKAASLEQKIGLGSGFVSLHRSPDKADHAVQEAIDHGERSKRLTWDEALELEPRVANLPFGPLYAVHRLDDITANCATYMRDKIERLNSIGVQYVQNASGAVDRIERLPEVKSEKDIQSRFRVTSADGSSSDYDYLILAAGVYTPLLARKIGAGQYCPTYPLRGYSLTVYTDSKSDEDMQRLRTDGKSTNLMNRPISVDNIYCSSVGPNMARLAGFGELCGFPAKALSVKSVGPRVLARYGRTLFPDGDAAEDNSLQCFRPMSPDDLPLVGEVSSIPGLYLHTGHGTLGWTLSLATAECVAQAVCDRIAGKVPGDTFELPDGARIKRRLLSPDRFVWKVGHRNRWYRVHDGRVS